MRQAYTEKEEGKKLKAKQRDKMAPKMGKMDINYHVSDGADLSPIFTIVSRIKTFIAKAWCKFYTKMLGFITAFNLRIFPLSFLPPNQIDRFSTKPFSSTRLAQS